MIEDVIQNVRAQSFKNIEHVIIDGDSQDGTKEIASRFVGESCKLFSAKDKGLYDALNRGIRECTFDVIGILHSDDLFAYPDVVSDVMKLFDQGADLVYGDLNYVSRSDTSRIIRKWKAGVYDPRELEFGWMPPHPTVFIKKSLIDKIGLYDIDYKIASDYDFLLRALKLSDIKISYLPRVTTLMRLGGESNKGLRNLMNKSSEDLKIMKKHFSCPLGTLICKNLRKTLQFLL